MIFAMTLRCVIVDDNADVRRSARELLELQGISVVGLAVNGDEALRVVETAEPDVVLLDVDLGPESGLEIAKRLGQPLGAGGPSIILMSTYEETDLEDLLVEPVLGFVAKSDLSAAAIERLVESRSGGRPGY